MNDSPAPGPEDPRSRDLVRVGNYGDALSAEAARSCLEMEGIDAEVFDGIISAMNGFYTTAFGGVKVMVARADEERARVILGSLDTTVSDEVVEEADEILPDGIYCEICHSKHVRTRRYWNVPTDTVVRFFASILSQTRVTRCRDCGHAVRS